MLMSEMEVLYQKKEKKNSAYIDVAENFHSSFVLVGRVRMMRGGNVRDAETGVAAASDASIDGYIGHTPRLKYNFKIIALKIKVTTIILIIETKFADS